MSQLSYDVFEIAVDEDAAGTAAGTPIKIVGKGTKIRFVQVLEVNPSTQPIRFHFGANGKQPWDVGQGDQFSDSAYAAAVNAYDDGLYYSIPPGNVPANGTVLRVGVMYVE